MHEILGCVKSEDRLQQEILAMALEDPQATDRDGAACKKLLLSTI